MRQASDAGQNSVGEWVVLVILLTLGRRVSFAIMIAVTMAAAMPATP